MHSGASGVARLERVCGRAAPDAPERVYDQRRCTSGKPSDVLPRIARERVPTIEGLLQASPGVEHIRAILGKTRFDFLDSFKYILFLCLYLVYNILIFCCD